MSAKSKPAATAAAWLDQAQGVQVPPDAVVTPARMAVRFGTIARAAAARLPFGAEPSGFRRVFAALAGGESSDDR